MPRPLSPERLDMILESLRAGLDLETAARAPGVGSTAQAVRDHAAESAEFYKAMMDAMDAGADARRAAPEAHPMAAPRAPGKPQEAPPPKAWAATIQASAEAQEPPEEGEEGDLVGDRWGLVRREAAGMAPGHLGTLLWIDMRCQEAGMHPLDPWWVETFGSFYASGKMILAADVGLRGAKSVSVCRSLVNDALFMLRDLDPGSIGVIPVMSSDRTEATDRFHTIKKILRACGLKPKKTKEDDWLGDVVPGGLDGVTYESSTLPSGGGVIRLEDSQGHQIEFRIYPAKITGAVGYTGVAGFCDEVDLWPVDALGVSGNDTAEAAMVHDGGRANPADVVLDRLTERFTTTRASAHLYIVSASYRGKNSAHWRKIEEGDTRIQYVARLGPEGARRDEEARRTLAASTGSTDPRLLAPADPRDVRIPSWVTNPSKASILDCYDLSRQRIGPMLGRYGGRPDESEAGGMLRDIKPAPCSVPHRVTLVDLVIGVAPSEDGSPWGIVVVGRDGAGIVTVIADASERLDGGGAAERTCALTSEHAATFAACAKGQEERVRAELGAHVSGRAVFAPPVIGVPIHDGPTLRVGPLRTLYQRGQLRHVGGLQALEEEAKGWTADGPRAARLEALCAAVSWLALGGQVGGGEAWEMTPVQVPKGSMVVGQTEDRGGPPAAFRAPARVR